MLIKILGVVAAAALATSGTAVAGERSAPKDIHDWSCLDFTENSSAGSADMSFTAPSSGTYVFDCSYGGDVTSCDYDDWSDAILSTNDVAYKTISWTWSPGTPLTQSIELFANDGPDWIVLIAPDDIDPMPAWGDLAILTGDMYTKLGEKGEVEACGGGA